MQATRLLLAASIAATTALAGAYSSDAYAQDDYDDLDLDGGESQAKKARSKRNPRDLASGPVKEITRGTYAKANIGGAFYLLDFRGFVSPGTSVALAVGREGQSLGLGDPVVQRLDAHDLRGGQEALLGPVHVAGVPGLVGGGR